MTGTLPRRRHPRLLRRTRGRDPRLGAYRSDGARFSPIPTHTAEVTAIRRAASASSTAPGIATAAAREAVRSLAATAHGYSVRGAIDLMVAYRLTEHRPYGHPIANARPGSRSTSPRTRPDRRARRSARNEEDIDRWQATLAADTDLIAKLTRDRGWLYATMLELELGVDRGRITIPVRDDKRRLIGLLRYQPWPQPGEPKMLATAGSRRALLPHPAAEPSTHVLLVEGEPDMIAARSRGLPAIAVPGIDGWRPAWAQLFAGREVTVFMDCDEQGRAAAAAIERDLSSLSRRPCARHRA